jgi:DNA-binding CsgD family transcriptional regulator
MNQHLFYDLFDKVRNLETPLKADALFETMRDMYGVKHVIYSRMDSTFCTHKDCFLLGTYTDDWLQHYFSNDYLSIDPVALHGFTALRSFDWRELSKERKEVKQIFDESIDFGFGHQGLCIPIVNSRGGRATFNINADVSDKEWIDLKSRLLRDLHIIAHFFHDSVVAQIKIETSDFPVHLSTRQLETLKWAASGKTIWETSVILSVSERTVRFHLDQARRTLNCATKTQAVAKAVASGLVNIT